MKVYALLIDSNTDFRQRAAAILRDRGFAVFEASTLEKAQSILEKETIHIVCVDAFVSGESGLGFINGLNRGERKYQLVFLSNPDRPSDTEELLKNHTAVDMLLHRPLSPEELIYKLETLVRLRSIESFRESRFKDGDTAVADRGPQERDGNSLQQSYGAKVPTLFSDIGRLLVASHQGADLTAAIASLEEARRISHMVTGTAGSIGFSEVSAVAHVVETWLKEALRLKRAASNTISCPAEPPEMVKEIRPSVTVKNPGTSIARVLVLDDDRDFLKSISAMGRDNLIRVYTASTGAEALDIAASRSLDAAILDVILSGDDNAFDIARHLRSMKSYTELPVGFISVDASLSRRIAAVHAGGSVFLDKPLDGETFAAAIRRLVPMTEESQPKILVVDDDKDFLSYITELLEAQGIAAVTLDNATNIVKDINEINPDMVLLDVIMEGVNGLDACRVLRSVEKWQDIPILVLTVHGNRDILVECYQAGADDYIEKPVIKEELMARINLRLGRMRVFKERADIDVLTGLPTRRPFIEMLKMRLSESGRFNKPVSLCLLDLDHFKQVNDKFGHLAGDRVLAGIGNLLKSRFRLMDVRGRWGGEEFVVAFYGEEEETARMIVSRVLEELRKISFIGDHGERFQVTFSAGVATYPTAGRTVEDLFRKVDENLYRAKNSGRNRIEI